MSKREPGKFRPSVKTVTITRNGGPLEVRFTYFAMNVHRIRGQYDNMFVIHRTWKSDIELNSIELGMALQALGSMFEASTDSQGVTHEIRNVTMRAMSYKVPQEVMEYLKDSDMGLTHIHINDVNPKEKKK